MDTFDCSLMQVLLGLSIDQQPDIGLRCSIDTCIYSKETTLARVRQHYASLLNHPPLINDENQVEPRVNDRDPEINLGLVSEAKVADVVRALKNARQSRYRTTPETLKESEEIVS